MLKNKTKKKLKDSKTSKPLVAENETISSNSDVDSVSTANPTIVNTNDVDSISSKDLKENRLSDVASADVRKSILESTSSNSSLSDEGSLHVSTTSLPDIKGRQDELYGIQRAARQRVSFFDRLRRLPSINSIQLTSDEEVNKQVKLKRKSKEKRKSPDFLKSDVGQFVDPLTGESSNSEETLEWKENLAPEDDDLLVEFEDFKDPEVTTSKESDFFGK